MQRSSQIFLFVVLLLVVLPSSLGAEAEIFVNGAIPVYHDWNRSDFTPLQAYTQIADYFKPHYTAAEPYEHMIFDGLIPPQLLREVAAEFPRHSLELGDEISSEWGMFRQGLCDNKFYLDNEERMGRTTQRLMAHLKSNMFVTFLQRLTGINNLLVDPMNFGGGLHQIGRGGFLSIHTDFNRSPLNMLFRRVDLLLYLNENWEESFGGHLEMWNHNVTLPGPRVLPVFNRLVLFSASRKSFHGHPDPLTCPPDRSRKSIALYYYTTGPGPTDNADDPHLYTLFRPRPGKDAWTGPRNYL